jgi:hypothetical protein
MKYLHSVRKLGISKRKCWSFVAIMLEVTSLLFPINFRLICYNRRYVNLQQKIRRLEAYEGHKYEFYIPGASTRKENVKCNSG